MFDPSAIRRQQTLSALGQAGAGLLGFAAGDPRALATGMAGAAQATDPSVIERERFRQQQMQLAQRQQEQQLAQQQALQAAMPALAEASGLPPEVLAIDPGAAMKAVMKARLDPAKMTAFDAFMSGTPEQRAAAEQWRQMGASSQNVNVNMPQFGPVEKGWQMLQDPSGAWRQERVYGGPAWEAQQRQAQKEARAQAATAVEGDLVNQAISDIRMEQREATLPVTGLGGDLLSGVPGTGAANVRSDIDFLKDRVSMRSLQNMRLNSPTGGALGNVTEKEGDRLASEYGRLSQSVGTEKFNRNLQRFEEAYNQIVHNRNPDGSMYRRPSPAGTGSRVPEVGVTEDGYRFKGGDPGDPANWERVAR